MKSPFRVLFVCMGNICRSPAAEGVLADTLQKTDLARRVVIDSAGTGGWHAGNRADSRMRACASDLGYDLTSIARQVSLSDFDSFDLILAMDKENLADLRQLQSRNPGRAEVRLFCDFCSEHDETEVPDPYYGGDEGFEKVLDLIEDGCRGILEHIRTHVDKP